MLLTDLLGWWYSRGWRWATRELFIVRPARTIAFFSVIDLLKTLMAPFRQDAVDVRRAPLGLRLQVITWNIISRFFGFIIRSSLILMGLVLTVLQLLGAVVAIVLWPLLPLSPLISFWLTWRAIV